MSLTERPSRPVSAQTDSLTGALCRQHPQLPPATWHDPERVAAAVAVCQVCPEQPRCVVANLHEQLGVWGTTERARRELRRLARTNPPEQLVRFARQRNERYLAGPNAAAESLRHPADMDDAEIRAIRQEYDRSQSFAAVASSHGISRPTCRRIVSGQVRPEAGGPIGQSVSDGDRLRWAQERSIVLALHRDGVGVDDIVKRTGYPRDRVRRVLNRHT